MQYYFAPLEGITGYLYRNIHHKHFPGIDRYYSPFVVTRDGGIMKRKELRDILPENNREVTLIPQILTNHAENFLCAAETMYELGYQEVNLNLGCPSGTVTGKGRGSGFLKWENRSKLQHFLCLYNIQFICDGRDEVYVIEVNPRSSRTVPFLSKATGVQMADIATQVILGHSLREQGITEVYGREKQRWFVKAPAFSFSKIRGVESYLSPEMKSTGEAIGYDDKLTRALYKALQASGMKVANYGTVLLTIADKDKEEVLPLARRFYNLGFNIEATSGTADFLRRHGLRTRLRRKLCEGSSEIIDSLRQGHVSYIINTIDLDQHNTRFDGYEIRRTAVENNVTLFTSLETVKVLLDVLEEITLSVSTIDAK